MNKNYSGLSIKLSSMQTISNFIALKNLWHNVGADAYLRSSVKKVDSNIIPLTYHLQHRPFKYITVRMYASFLRIPFSLREDYFSRTSNYLTLPWFIHSKVPCDRYFETYDNFMYGATVTKIRYVEIIKVFRFG